MEGFHYSDLEKYSNVGYTSLTDNNILGKKYVSILGTPYISCIEFYLDKPLSENSKNLLNEKLKDKDSYWESPHPKILQLFCKIDIELY